MLANNYYQTSIEKTTPLALLSESQCCDGFAALTPYERNCLKGQGFQGLLGSLGFIHDQEGELYKIYVGAGDKDTDAMAMASVANLLPVGVYRVESPLSEAANIVWSLAQYQFDKYKVNEVLPRILVVSERALPSVLAEASAVFLVRDLINTPTNDLGPKELSQVVKKLAGKFGAEFKEWVGDELLSSNFPAIHAVGRAAASAPRLLSLVWGNQNHPRVALIGKGVCFDSGGLDLKPSSNMRWMKKDMGGAAQVIGLAQWLMTHQIPICLHVLIPAVENSVGSEAYRPGDVLTMRNGLSVEIHNTDAEGRLVLADALVKACEAKPELVIDFATLTGSARAAVGTDIAAMFANDDILANELTTAAQEVGDPIWRLPLFSDYSDLFESQIADFANASESPFAGAITAALFLQRFITADIPWAHFDIMAWNIIGKPGKPVGGEVIGMRAVGHYLREKYQS